jgi:hypothetical protein
MLTLNALVELLSEKGVLTQAEVLERVKKLRSKTKVSARRENRFGPEHICGERPWQGRPVFVCCGRGELALAEATRGTPLRA